MKKTNFYILFIALFISMLLNSIIITEKNKEISILKVKLKAYQAMDNCNKKIIDFYDEDYVPDIETDIDNLFIYHKFFRNRIDTNELNIFKKRHIRKDSIYKDGIKKMKIIVKDFDKYININEHYDLDSISEVITKKNK